MAFYLAIVTSVVIAILLLTHHLIYCLDDPYIHLALAQQIAHGHYGINANEVTSPSSSILWPFLLAPFAWLPFFNWMPLLLSVAFGCVTTYFIGRSISWIMPAKPGREQPIWALLGGACLLMFSASLPALTVDGMEHVVQVSLAVGCALGIARVILGQDLPGFAIACAVIAPCIRYEDLSLTLAVSLALWGVERRRTAILTFLGSLLIPAGFGLFLHENGLPVLPLSVLVKGNAVSHQSPLATLLSIVHRNLETATYQRRIHAPPILLTALLVYFCVIARTRRERWALIGCSCVGALQLTLGRFGWLQRYEVFATCFLTITTLVAVTHFRAPRILIAPILLLGAVNYIGITALSPVASRVIYLQQFQMHRFVTQFYEGNYAVNDLGLTSFDKRPDSYVLDLWGLASPEAAANREKSAAWLSDTVRRHRTPLAMIYSTWFSQLPADWIMVGRMCETANTWHVLIGEPCVSFYSTDPSRTAEIRADFARFAPTVPRGDEVELVH